MSESTKHHFYPYTVRSVGFQYSAWCGGKILLYVIPPEKAQTIENLYVHFKATFNSGIPSGNRKIKAISVVDRMPPLCNSNGGVNYMRTQEFDISADANRKVDIKIDISHLLKKDNVAYGEYMDVVITGATMVMIEPDDALIGNNNIGTIDLWKVDAQFTTQGIR